MFSCIAAGCRQGPAFGSITCASVSPRQIFLLHPSTNALCRTIGDIKELHDIRLLHLRHILECRCRACWPTASLLPCLYFSSLCTLLTTNLPYAYSRHRAGALATGPVGISDIGLNVIFRYGPFCGPPHHEAILSLQCIDTFAPMSRHPAKVTPHVICLTCLGLQDCPGRSSVEWAR